VRVLIVEDEARRREFISNGLAAEGIARYGARSGAEAVDGSLNGHFDLVLLDHYLAKLFSPVVDVCVRRPRRKLGPTTPIETLRHAGYRFAAD
jgi:DNA-binding response OmpR family regulator